MRCAKLSHHARQAAGRAASAGLNGAVPDPEPCTATTPCLSPALLSRGRGRSFWPQRPALRGRSRHARRFRTRGHAPSSSRCPFRPGDAARPDRHHVDGWGGPGASGFRLMLGLASMDTRLALLRGAQRSLDLQYYHLHNDATGGLVLRELRNAALRGVRVRLLVDDLYTEDIGPLLDGLAPTPTWRCASSIRSPRAAAWSPASAGPVRLRAVDRRMHNKLFVADGVLAVAGGRNLGDIYFMRDADNNFFDYDVLWRRGVVADRKPLRRVLERPAGAHRGLRAASIDRHRCRAPDFDTRWMGPTRPSRCRFAPSILWPRHARRRAEGGRVKLAFGKAQAFADAPAKAWGRMETRRLPSGALIDTSRRLLARRRSRRSRRS